MSEKCNRCKGGLIRIGNNEFMCDCSKGSTVLFNDATVDGLVSGAELRRHFFNGSPEPLNRCDKQIKASSLPGRNKDLRQLEKIYKQFSGLIEISGTEELSQVRGIYTFAHILHTLTSKMLGK